MQPSIEVRHLSRRYGPRLALDDVSFAVAPGEILGLLGRNGAGKTTTVEILEGFRSPSAGTVRVLERDPRRADRQLRSRVGVVLQSSSAEVTLRTREAVALYATFYRSRRNPDALLAEVGLTEQAHVRVGVLSGGQRRRLDLALAVAGEPDVLFLDEPTTGLDPEGRRRIWDLVGRLGALLDEADAYCKQGELLTLASPPVVRRFRTWYLAEIRAQLAGAAPGPWPGPVDRPTLEPAGTDDPKERP